MARSPEVHFRLKPKDAKGQSLIYLQFLYNKQRLFFSFGQKIKPENWNEKRQRVKNVNLTTADGKYRLNDMLDNLEKECYKAYNGALVKGVPSPELLQAHLKDVVYHNENEKEQESENNLFGLIDRFINNEIKHKGKRKTDNTIKAYRTAGKNLRAFEAYMRTLPRYKDYKLDFNSIDLDFFYRYVDFLSSQTKEVNGQVVPLIESQNTLAKYIQTLKVFMGEAVDLGYTNNLQYKHRKFVIDRVETDAVYLTENELTGLYKHDFSNNKRLEQVRDLFIFGAWVGLRFSDYSNVKPENIVQIEGDYFIKLITKKTTELVVVPCNPVVLEIFKKYEHNRNRLPDAISNQKFNEYLHEVCKEAGLTEKGRLSTAPELDLWKCISSHTARRSFATNYYLQGFPTIDLMKITGHKTEKVFLNYIRHSKLDTAKRLSKHIKAWSEKVLRVA